MHNVLCCTGGNDGGDRPLTNTTSPARSETDQKAKVWKEPDTRKPLTLASSIPRVKKKGVQHQVEYDEFVQQLLEAANERPCVQLSQKPFEKCNQKEPRQSKDSPEHISEQHRAMTANSPLTHIEMKDSETPSPETSQKAVRDEAQYAIEGAVGHIHRARATPKPRRAPLAEFQGEKENAMSETIQEVQQTPSPDATKEEQELSAAIGAKQIATGSSSVAAVSQLNFESQGNHSIAERKAKSDTIQQTPSPVIMQRKEKMLIEAQAEHSMSTRSSVAALIQSPLDKREKERTARHRTTGQSGDDDQTMAESVGEGAGGGTCEGAERKKVKPDSFPRASRGASPKTSIPETSTTTSPGAALQRATSKRSTTGRTVLQEKVPDERTSEATPTKNRPRKKRQFAQAFGIFKTPILGHVVSSDIDSSDAEDGHDVHSIVNPSDRVPQLPLQPTPELRRKRRDKGQSDSQDAVVYTTPQYSEWNVAGKGLAASGDVQSSRLLEDNSIDTIRQDAEVKRRELVSRADIMASAESAVAHYSRP
ncbi:hypothetical protein BDV97DRAFT_365581 [Delphinella strobiligena]|nr:hypothetical protein BDV97DRAFT_365581 [Delphinella strobiligena]